MKISHSTRGHVLTKILTTIANAVVAYSHHPGRISPNIYKAMREFDELQELSDRQLRAYSRYIIEKKYIKISTGPNGSVITLEEKGRKYTDRSALDKLKPRQVPWDGRWRVVMFDIPNERKSARDAFAGTLKRFDFQRLQKSVFISPYPCEEELEIVAEYYGISDDVDILLVERFARQKEFKKYFKLK